MNNQVDITMSVLIDNAMLEYEKATEKVIRELGLSVDLAEIALEKSLLNLQRSKISLYASAMYNQNNLQLEVENEGSITTTVEPAQ